MTVPPVGQFGSMGTEWLVDGEVDGHLPFGDSEHDPARYTPDTR